MSFLPHSQSQLHEYLFIHPVHSRNPHRLPLFHLLSHLFTELSAKNMKLNGKSLLNRKLCNKNEGEESEIE
jgi:hypothetical protein